MMRNIWPYFLMLFFIWSNPSIAVELKTKFLRTGAGSGVLELRIGIMTPSQPILGDILYLHGFGDRFDNHQDLFKEWVKSGFRVISFDLPSHGENRGPNNNLNNFSFFDLANLAASVEQNTKPTSNRPLIISGWSTGGLVVVRTLQAGWTSGFSRPISGAILFAPGVSVRKFPWTFGNRFGEITEDTLTHNSAFKHILPVNPDSPFWNTLVAKFSPRLVLESVLSQNLVYPLDIPTIVYTGGDRNDMYAKPWSVRKWVKEQNYQRILNSKEPIKNISCPQARHELDNESDIYGGNEVRVSAASFAKAVVESRLSDFKKIQSGFGTICTEHSLDETAFGGALNTFWVLSRDYANWYTSSPRGISDFREWPAGFSPQNSNVFSHNEIFIKGPPQAIFAKLQKANKWSTWYPNAGAVKIVEGENLAQGVNFTWRTFETLQKSKVTLFELDKAIGWTADSFGVQAFHRWLLYPEGDGTRVVTEECDNGLLLDIGVSVLLNPGLHASHQIWLENLKNEIERSKL